MKNGWEFYVLDRSPPKNEWILYENMPEFLSQFEYFIDRKEIKSLSKTALEALCLGMKIVSCDEKIVSELNPIHAPLNVAKNTIKQYLKEVFE